MLRTVKCDQCCDVAAVQVGRPQTMSDKMELRPLASLFTLALAIQLGACSGYDDLTSSAPSLAILPIGTIEVPTAIADAGCALGASESSNSSRVLVLGREQLPFALPPLQRISSATNRHASFRIVRVGIPAAKAGKRIVLACLLPVHASGSMVTAAANAVPASGWQALSARLASGKSISRDVSEAVGTALREATFPNARHVDGHKATVGSNGISRSNWSCPSCAPQYLSGITVTAGGNWSVIDHWVIDGFFSQYGERPPPYIDWYLENACCQCERRRERIGSPCRSDADRLKSVGWGREYLSTRAG